MAQKQNPRNLSEADFQRIFNEVRADINDLQLHEGVFTGVVEQLTRYPQLAHNYKGFFSAFYAATRTDLIIRLGRVYDPEGTGHDSCTLARCLVALRDNSQFFTDAAITARQRKDYRDANPDFLTFHRLNANQTNADLDTIAKTRTRLIKLRHKVYAHKDVETVLTGKRDEFLSSHDEVKALINLADQMWNRYSLIWNASAYSDKPLGGGDDYKWLFQNLRRGLKVKSHLDNRQFERWRKRVARVNAALRLDDAKVTGYCNSFLGFGMPSAPIWFVGIEEAGGKKFEEVARRLAAWDNRGQNPFEDAPVFYPLCGNNCWHGNAAGNQDTWRKLILMLLVARGEDAEEPAILRYQKTLWGGATGNTCLVELLPLPSPSTEDWNYGLWSNLAWLATRESYVRAVRAGRENELRRQVREKEPKVVVFYGLELPGDISLLPSWSSIAGGRFVQAFEDREILLTRTNGNTTYYVTRHPRAESDEYFREIGLFLKCKHGSQI